MTVLFKGGQLQVAETPDGPWIDTGDFSGGHTEPVGMNPMRYYRVRGP
jgi:hypothetical protein